MDADVSVAATGTHIILREERSSHLGRRAALRARNHATYRNNRDSGRRTRRTNQAAAWHEQWRGSTWNTLEVEKQNRIGAFVAPPRGAAAQRRH
ncbi:hypothetical protein E2C01_084232 [Portunus trituberculatus]|uniref:Uncharacterized protein n=1 Tax=Portunus trituberculatus TaxID=210409 RepID=A0A5B7J496_PORTR|nr:hypothetical protein [Portunus trituberculatus]